MEIQELIERSDGALARQFLLAMPGIADERFQRAVIFLLAHSDDGALGFVLSDPADLEPDDMFRRAGLDDEMRTGRARDLPVLRGGPVEASRGFVVHSTDYMSATTVRVDDDIALTSTLDILRALARGKGPERAFLALGYAAWGAGQLEDELRENVWLTVETEPLHVLRMDAAERYDGLLATMGIAPGALSAAAGNA